MMNHEPVNRRLPRHTTLRRVVGSTAAMLVISALTGCPKPPPPPPPPPPPAPVEPPPPPEVSLNDLLQELKADPRVQFAADVRLTDETFARAIIELADTFAKGNDAKLQGMLDAGANNQLSGLVESGEWTDSTKPIEAVRIVYAGAFDASMAMSSGGAIGSVPTAQLIEQIKQAISSGAGAGVMDVLEQQGTIPAEQLAIMRAQFEKFSTMTPEQIGEEMKKALATFGGTEGSVPAITEMNGAVPTRGVLLAIQDPRGAYLLGWGALQAGDKWVFTNAPAAAGDRSRASAWDGIGPVGFMYSSLASGASFDSPMDSLSAPDDSSDAGGGSTPSSTEPSAPTRKNTPAGPVTIPGGG